MFGIWEQIYLGLFVFGTGFLLLQVFLGQFGDADLDSDFDADLDVDTDFDVDGDFDADLDTESGSHAGLDVSFLTPLIIAPMLAGVGAVGLFVALFLNSSVLLHLPLALLGGFALGYAIFFVLAKVIAPMQGSSEVRVGELWGTVAEVITPIPENRLGEIRFVARGSYISAPARSVTGELIPRGQMVMIEKVENSVAFVRPTQ
ncbi:MAG: MSCRAMM family adhesin SdrC [Chloroflexota bacterium]|nr:MSCRAMM family adhesin SdrC [Chloroflexota bacterium]